MEVTISQMILKLKPLLELWETQKQNSFANLWLCLIQVSVCLVNQMHTTALGRERSHRIFSRKGRGTGYPPGDSQSRWASGHLEAGIGGTSIVPGGVAVVGKPLHAMAGAVAGYWQTRCAWRPMLRRGSHGARGGCLCLHHWLWCLHHLCHGLYSLDRVALLPWPDPISKVLNPHCLHIFLSFSIDNQVLLLLLQRSKDFPCEARNCEVSFICKVRHQDILILLIILNYWSITTIITNTFPFSCPPSLYHITYHDLPTVQRWLSAKTARSMARIFISNLNWLRIQSNQLKLTFEDK